jgi:amino acid transporter
MLLNNVMNTIQGKPTFEMITTILMASGPFLLMLAVIAFILYLIITYSKIISEGRVSNGYYTFSNISIILFLLQIYLLYSNMDTEKFKQTYKLSSITSSLLYLLGVITSMCSLILYTILKYFTTDG